MEKREVQCLVFLLYLPSHIIIHMKAIPPFLSLAWNCNLSNWSCGVFRTSFSRQKMRFQLRGFCIFLIQFKRLPSRAKPVGFGEYLALPDFQTQVTNTALGNDSISGFIWKLFLVWDFREINDIQKEVLCFKDTLEKYFKQFLCESSLVCGESS